MCLQTSGYLGLRAGSASTCMCYRPAYAKIQLVELLLWSILYLRSVLHDYEYLMYASKTGISILHFKIHVHYRNIITYNV